MILSTQEWQANLALSNDHFQLNQGESMTSSSGQLMFSTESVAKGFRLKLAFAPQGQQEIGQCSIETEIPLQPQDWLLCNGFQSWTESHWLHPDGQIPQLRRIAKPLMGYYGDYHIPWIKRKKAYLHSWSWTELRRADQPLLFMGSLNEQTAFTCFQWQYREGKLRIDVDCRGWQVSEPVILLDIVVLEGDTHLVYDEWVKNMKLPPLRAQAARGWTSWYNHYTNISAPIIEENLKAHKDSGQQLDFFQIDDGYQTAVGDWLSVKDSFPEGMKVTAQKIREYNCIPGLWLAPCVADRRSDVLRKHPDWVRTNANGKPLKAGYNPLWKGWFYALDTEHTAWQDYMRTVMETVVQDWGYGMLKLDFLYAACIFPTARYTRAQLMHRTLSFIREAAGEAYLLGCGTPLASGFGIFDYCRIGADIHLKWEHQMLKWFRHRERVSSLASLRSTLSRWPLAGRVWRNDPDVYLLRDDNMQMSEQERSLVHRINTLLGELLFSSDNPDTYGKFQQEEMRWQQEWWGRRAREVSPTNNSRYKITVDQKEIQVVLGNKTGSMSES